MSQLKVTLQNKTGDELLPKTTGEQVFLGDGTQRQRENRRSGKRLCLRHRGQGHGRRRRHRRNSPC